MKLNLLSKSHGRQKKFRLFWIHWLFVQSQFNFPFCWLYSGAGSVTQSCMIGLLRPCLPTLMARLLVTLLAENSATCLCQCHPLLRSASFPPCSPCPWLCLTLGLLKPDSAKIYLYPVWVITHCLIVCFQMQHINMKDQALYSVFLLMAGK